MDIRELLKSLSLDDRIAFYRIRNDMRKVYLNAHTNVLGMEHWEEEDDQYLDLLEIKLAVLFDRAGLLDTGGKEVIGKEDAVAIEQNIHKQGDDISDGTRKLQMMPKGGWN